MTPQTHVAVIGAGPAGLTAALRMHRSGARVTIFEASSDVGGLARSLDLWGHHVELSAHIFWSQDDFVTELWDEFVDEPVAHSLSRALLTGGRVIPYPLSPLNIARGVRVTDLARAVLGLAAAKVGSSSEDDNAEAWMVANYGRPLYELFFRDYAEKLWGVPCHQIEGEFPRSLFGEVSATRGFEQTFVRPRRGVGSVWTRMAEHLEAEGVAIHTDERVERIEHRDDRVTGMITSNRELPVDGVISTMPLGRLAGALFDSDPALGEAGRNLTARSTVLVYLRATGDSCPFNWLALYSADFRFGRITDFGSLAAADEGSTVYCLEAWCDQHDDMWGLDDDRLAALATEELMRTGQFGDVTVHDHHVQRVPGTHPSAASGTARAADAIAAKVASVSGIATVGRGGGHSIHGMAESMASAKSAADLLLAKCENVADRS